MHEILKIVSLTLYLLIGVISLIMAAKNLFAVKLLPFQEKAYGKPWDDLDGNLKLVIITIMRVTGLGFLVVAILLLIFPVVNYFRPDPVIKYSIPLITLGYCAGLFLTSFLLFKKTKAGTPWKRSLVAMFIIIVALVLSIL